MKNKNVLTLEKNMLLIENGVRLGKDQVTTTTIID